MALRIVPFETAHLGDAATLLARRQAWLRETDPALPEAFTRADATLPLLDGLLNAKEAHGVAGLLDGRLVAYLVGSPRYDQVWNRAVWSPVEGSAVDPDADRDVIRDLYAAWAEHWVERGIFLHYVHAPAADGKLLNAWFELNFGKMQAHAVRDLGQPLAPGSRWRRDSRWSRDSRWRGAQAGFRSAASARRMRSASRRSTTSLRVTTWRRRRTR